MEWSQMLKAIYAELIDQDGSFAEFFLQLLI